MFQNFIVNFQFSNWFKIYILFHNLWAQFVNWSLSLKCFNLHFRMCFLVYLYCVVHVVHSYETFKPCNHQESSRGACLKKVYHCPYDDCRCTRVVPFDEKLSPKEYCQELSKLHGVTPLPLCDSHHSEGHWTPATTSFSAALTSAPALTYEEIMVERHQAWADAMARFMPEGRCQLEVEERVGNLIKLNNAWCLQQKFTSEDDVEENEVIQGLCFTISKCKWNLSITVTESIPPVSKHRWPNSDSIL